MDLRSLLIKQKTQLKSCNTILKNANGTKFEIRNGQVIELGNDVPFVIDTKPDLQVAEVIPNLFLGGQDPTANLEVLRQYNIRYVLSIGVKPMVQFEGIIYNFINLLDLPESDITKPLESCVKIIREHLCENIFVHCNAGVSRSATVAIAYLMLENKYSYDAAFEKVKKVRQCIKPNDGFVRQLKLMVV